VVPAGNIGAAAVLMMFVGVNVASPNVLYRSIMADVVDYDEVETGQRRTGLFYALLTFTAKVGNALAIGVVYWILAAIGFDPNAANSPAAIRGLSMVFVAVPVICNLLVIALMRNFPIGQREHAELRRILEQRTATISPSAKASNA
jgi:GPH family glycoside/pentoside/hexuronide:cation symporter